MLGRVVTHWNEIVGERLAGKTQPVKIRYFNSKGSGKSVASLDIASSTADATILHYQKDLILERINQIFGDQWIGAIRFVPIADNDRAKPVQKPAPKRILNTEEQNSLSNMLESIEDPVIKEQLERLGKSILQNKTK